LPHLCRPAKPSYHAASSNTLLHQTYGKQASKLPSQKKKNNKKNNGKDQCYYYHCSNASE
jgi:hypothetical protein